MGHNKKKSPRRGSKQYWPRKRAKRIYPIIKNWAKIKEPRLLGFAGYKAGMTSIFAIDNKPKSPTKGQEIKIPVTVLEAPQIKVIAIRLYSSTEYGLKVLGETWVRSDAMNKELSRKINIPKKTKFTIEKLKELLPKAEEVRVLIHTIPKLTGLKKKPEIMEMPIGGIGTEHQFEYAVSILGKEISAKEVFKEGEFLDIHAITTGKGFQGVVKRFGVRLQSHKAEKGRRKIATMGSFVPKNTPWWIAQPGQMGFHKRTEYNKQLLKIGEANEKISPNGDFIRYGKVKSPWILLAGSVAGPKKRLIVLSHAIRQRKGAITQAPEIVEISLRSQQGR